MMAHDVFAHIKYVFSESDVYFKASRLSEKLIISCRLSDKLVISCRLSEKLVTSCRFVDKCLDFLANKLVCF